MKKLEFRKDHFLLSNDKALLDVSMIFDFLSNSYWGQGLTPEKLRLTIEHSICFGLYEDGRQIGFARLLTDFGRIAYLMDVFILKEMRGKGLSKWTLTCILSIPELKSLKWILGTRDAHGLYEKFGFRKVAHPERMMEKPAE